MKIIECPQYSPEWWAARRGVPTASNFHRIITPAKGELAKAAVAYIHELLADKIKFDPPVMTEQPATEAMRFGTATEPAARDWYSFTRDVDIRQVGFCLTEDERFGCSPDGLVGEDGGVEIKCPELKTHVGYLLAGTLPDEYKPQVHGQLLITGRAWWDFVSYHPDSRDQLVIRVTPNKFTDQLRDVLEQFWAHYRAAWERLKAPPPVPTEVAA